MRYTFFFVFLSLTFGVSAQDLITVKAGEDLSVLRDVVYRYKDFQEARVYLLEGDSAGARMNYNLFDGSMHFIQGKDTLQLDGLESIRLIVIGKDSFYHYKGHILRNVQQYGFAQLLVQDKLKQHDEHRIGAMGMARPTHNIDSKSSFNSWQTLKLQLNRDLIFSKEQYYYYQHDRKVAPVTRKTLTDLFSFAGKHAFRDYDVKLSPDLKKDSDLQAMFRYMDKKYNVRR